MQFCCLVCSNCRMMSREKANLSAAKNICTGAQKSCGSIICCVIKMLNHSSTSWNLNIMLGSRVIMATENSYDCVRRARVSKVLCVERSLNGCLGVLLPFWYSREQHRLSPLECRRWTFLSWYDSSRDPGGHHSPSVPLWNGAWWQGHLQKRWVFKLAAWTGTRQDGGCPRHCSSTV